MVIGYYQSFGQVDTTFIYNNNMPYGSLDIRLAISATWYYYLEENKTFSFRESAPGVRTNTYRDMTSWDSEPYMQGHLREKNSSSDEFVMNYRLLLPQNYNASYAAGYPMIVILHGLGERANCGTKACYHADENYSPVTNTPPAPTNPDFELLNNDHQLSNGGNIHLKARNDAGAKLPDDPTLTERSFPGFVLFPQNLNGWNATTTQDAIRIIRLISKKYNIDENRIYIQGLSNGGHGVYETIKRAPWLFAAALTMSAIDDGYINAQKMAPSIAHIPMWTFQGALDINPYPQKTENYIKQFRDAGAVVRYTKYENLGHGTWNTAYREPDFFSWMLDKNRANIHVFAGNPTTCGGTAIKLQLPEGYLAYQWQFNGQTISAANTAFYETTKAGKYKARFSRVANPTESQWNRWSDEVEVKEGQGLPQAQINQVGTVLLKDLNNFADARLEAVGTFGHYYWFKDGTLIDFPGDQDDTIKYAVIKPTMGKGVYTLITSNFDNCKSAVSAGKYLFFNNQAPVNITAPSNFKGVVNATEVTLSWTDASGNENGFEIWRRRKIDDTSFSAWEMTTLTNANVTSFVDKNLFPSSTYHYKIRGVSNSGRSDYFPSATNLELVTGQDKEAPTAPKNLSIKPLGVKKMKLMWQPSTDNSALSKYIIYYGTDSAAVGSTDTTMVLTDLPLNNLFTFKVKAQDVAGNLSLPSNSVQGSTYVSGLYYEHSTGLVTDLDSIDWSAPEFTGMIQTFSLAPKTQEDYFNFRFDGFLLITKEGTYQFRMGSDDGSRLKLENNLIIENDGTHDFKVVTSANRQLTKGAHRITVDFFDYVESDSISVEYKGPDTNNEWATISISVLKSSESIVTALDPDNSPEDSFKLSIYPNPSKQENIHVKLETIMRSPVQIQMLDPVGRKLSSQVFEPEQLREGINLSTEGILPEGIYFIIVSQGKTTARQRVIIKN